MTTPTPTTAESPSPAGLAAECKRLVSRLQDAAYCHGLIDAQEDGSDKKFRDAMDKALAKRVELVAAIDRLAALASPPVTVPADERAAFEAWANARRVSRYEKTRNTFFIVWQARAALSTPTVQNATLAPIEVAGSIEIDGESYDVAARPIAALATLQPDPQPPSVDQFGALPIETPVGSCAKRTMRAPTIEWLEAHKDLDGNCTAGAPE